jgi:serine/threonine protein kinase/rhodanese-related sulfurtransferase
VALVRGKHERLNVVSEHYRVALRDVICNERLLLDARRVAKFAREIVDALAYLGRHGVVHRNLHWRNVRLDAMDRVKLADFGMYFVSDGGREVPFFVGAPGFAAPEVVVRAEAHADAGSGLKADVWSLGVLLLLLMCGENAVVTADAVELQGGASARRQIEAALNDTFRLLGHSPDECARQMQRVDKLLERQSGMLSPTTPRRDAPPPQPPKTADLIDFSDVRDGSTNSFDVEQTAATATPPPPLLPDTVEAMAQRRAALLASLVGPTNYPDALKSLVAVCLQPSVSRPDVFALQSHPAFDDVPSAQWVKRPVLRCLLPPDSSGGAPGDANAAFVDVERWSLHELFFFWQMAGGNVEASMSEQMRARPAIQRLPLVVRLRGVHDDEPTGSATPAVVTVTAATEEPSVAASAADSVNGSMRSSAAAPVRPATTPAQLSLPSSAFGDGIPTVLKVIDGVDEEDEPDVVTSGTLKFRRHRRDDALRYDERIVSLDLEQLRAILSHETLAVSAVRGVAALGSPPPAVTVGAGDDALQTKRVMAALAQLERQWMAAREVFMARNGALPSLQQRRQDLDYQRVRLWLYKRLLALYPLQPSRVRKVLAQHAKIDIQPRVRSRVWAALLEVTQEQADAEWAAFDIEKPGTSDHQIDLDIPRCHQYHPLLSSPAGHEQLRRVLRCWVARNEGELVYWQGLDSVLAPFVGLFFGNDAMASACLQAFVRRHLARVYRADNTVFLQEQLLLFRQLLAYHDPPLAVHLNRINFQPDLYAIPWFLTLFTHILPLDKIYPIWDLVLVGRDGLPQFFALAMMKQLRNQLLPLDFNQCIMLFSNLPEIDIDLCLEDAMAMLRITPGSVAVSKFDDADASTTATNGGSAGNGGGSGLDLDFIVAAAPPPVVADETAADRWWEVRPPLDELRAEITPRISLHDMLSESQRDGGAVVFDVRPKEQFQAVRFPGSFHFNLLKLDDAAVANLERSRGRPLVVVSGRGDDGYRFAGKLVQMGFPYVSVLHGGIDILLADCNPQLVRAKQ